MKAMTKTFLMTAVVTFCITLGFGQVTVTDLGQNAFYLGPQFVSADESSIVGVSAGYISNGKLDLGISLGLEELNEYDISSTAVRPYIGYLVVKQGENDMPVNVRIGGAYQYNIFKDLEELTANTFSLGSNVSHVIQSSSKIAFVPYFGFSWSRSQLNLDGYGEESVSGLSFSLGGTLGLDKFFMTPSIAFKKGRSSFAITLGMLFNQ